eukprot:CAMPEP_0114690456 /NCGR_PEP_ID=MMETSP0191-20121206/65739_1 /TAXON_ID=126664 /ORGANISM="Sorites sp." /LENGTH=46 /DNA_ID= /DNA_START= /DNA_END= /DNA_ORIENTATION=
MDAYNDFDDENAALEIFDSIYDFTSDMSDDDKKRQNIQARIFKKFY